MRAVVLTMALMAAVPAAAQQHQHGQGAPAQGQHADHGAAHATGIPAGWEMRLDRPNSTAPIHFMSMEGHLHAILGPAGIFYQPTNTATGAFTAQGTFTLNKPSEHPEAFGMLVGGRDLQGAGQDYLYFLVRQDGQFMVKHRAGAETHTLIDWTEHAAVRRPGADGKATNTLAVESAATGVRFLVNGTEVGTLPRGVNTDGVVGLRLNHNLDVVITDFAVHPAGHAGH
ncbi:hypothetical protein [Longimicrobium sp.]|uniref:hypothetical protein n=1 Tax=Longimicrobium sp. TaxID=2029185 RepID=UPI002E373E7D|nr:hypothetical protein [Longimicrobium sp.]HEX6041007.1 hypothetical protein [Longimicrobium sp.]